MVKRLEEKIKEAEKDLAAATSKTARNKAMARIKAEKKSMASESALKRYYNE